MLGSGQERLEQYDNDNNNNIVISENISFIFTFYFCCNKFSIQFSIAKSSFSWDSHFSMKCFYFSILSFLLSILYSIGTFFNFFPSL